jgi:hypothetical protein
MFNFSGKTADRPKRSLNINLTTFWKSLDNSYFPLSPTTLLHIKYKEIAGGLNSPKKEEMNNLEEKLKRATADSSIDQPIEEKKKRKKKGRKVKKENKLKLNSNILLGCYIQQSFEGIDNINPTHTELDIEMDQINRCIEYYESENESFIQNLTQRINAQTLNSAYDMYKNRKQLEIEYLKYEIYKLESKQLAESVISIKNSNTSALEYDVYFEEALGIFPMRLKREQVIMLSKFRVSIFHTSPYDAAIAAKKFECKNARPSIKSIPNLLDTEMINRRIDYTAYGFCHHCKEIQDLNKLVKCNKNSNSSLVRLFIGKHEKGTRGISRYHTKNPRLSCERMYCFACVFFNYDQDPSNEKTNPNWTCPYCQVCDLVHNRINASVLDVYDTITYQNSTQCTVRWWVRGEQRVMKEYGRSANSVKMIQHFRR